jgi:hypothetical protein
VSEIPAVEELWFSLLLLLLFGLLPLLLLFGRFLVGEEEDGLAIAEFFGAGVFR